MPQKEKRLTKRQRKELFGKGPTGTPKSKHIHCISCGRHLNEAEFTAIPPSTRWLTCQQGSRFAACVGCTADAQARLDEHDRTGQPPQVASAWH
jgi:hypothetical protein